MSLVVKGHDLDPDTVTSKLDLQPTGTRSPGHSRWGSPADINGEWRLRCDERSTRRFSEQLETILTAVEPHSKDLIELLANDISVTLTIRGYVDNDSQIILTPEEIRRVARLGIPVVFAPSTSER
ncbi:DUF4279 domain-containing protein [Streptomyces sp. ISL-10]|uniref:DUF4279 domain-containing protein n=1 Tax=Streptomyces sp. ISL-10 TaxID=2819172 RepID=UPI001BE93007|nr:DUF4279 domain-containing protein [Streptomyces sp. ISL-10]MBT2367124.1 DUF4279 domain-containing protein [Streptomyces sp. ISL-10]